MKKSGQLGLEIREGNIFGELHIRIDIQEPKTVLHIYCSLFCQVNGKSVWLWHWGGLPCVYVGWYNHVCLSKIHSQCHVKNGLAEKKREGERRQTKR